MRAKLIAIVMLLVLLGATLANPGNPIGRRDYERVLDDAVQAEIAKRFSVLCTRLGKPDNPQAFEDFKHAVLIIFEARELAEEFLLKELTRRERQPGGVLSPEKTPDFQQPPEPKRK